MSKISAAITAVGAYVPDYVLTNQILETMVDTNDEWITSRTGIKERRILKDDGKGTSYLAIKAAQDLINKKGIDPKDIELIIVATATPDMKAASTAAFTASEIGATNAFSFDMDAACSSFLFGMSVASSYVDTQLSDEQVQDIIGLMVTDNTETNIVVTYDDTGGKLNFEVDLSAIPTVDGLISNVATVKLG